MAISKHLQSLILAAPLLLAACQTAPVQNTPAQAAPVQPAPIQEDTPASPLNWNGQNSIELPLTLDRGRRPTVPVRVMGRDTTALLDSGSGIPAISRTVATDAGIGKLQAEVNGQRVDTVSNIPLELGRMSTVLPMAVLIDHNAERPVVLGAEIFLHAIVEMDFEAGRLRLFRPATFTPPPAQPVPVVLWNSVPTLQLTVNGQARQICAVIDTGFNGGLALTSEIVTELALPPDPAGGTRVARDGFGNRYERPLLAPLNELRFGSLAYQNVPVTQSLPLPLAGSQQCGNVLGMAVLYRLRLIFDLQNQRVWLLPRAGNP
jgi:hypothetical protein